MPNPRKIIAIINPNAGTKNKTKVLNKLKVAFESADYELSIFETLHAGHARDLSVKAVAENAETVIAVGGDGTINEVSSAIIGTSTKLGIISMGSGNGFSRHAGIHGSIDKAVQTLQIGYSELIDTCLLNGKSFINLAGIGIDGEVAYLTKTNSKRGLIPYIVSTFKAKGFKQSFSATICYNDSCIIGDYKAIVVANAQRYGFKFKIAPLASMQDGLLDVILIKDAPMWKYIVDFPKFLTGKLASSTVIEIFKSTDVEVKLDIPQFHHIDGEGSNEDTLSFNFEIKPSSLNLILDKGQKLSL